MCSPPERCSVCSSGLVLTFTSFGGNPECLPFAVPIAGRVPVLASYQSPIGIVQAPASGASPATAVSTAPTVLSGQPSLLTALVPVSGLAPLRIALEIPQVAPGIMGLVPVSSPGLVPAALWDTPAVAAPPSTLEPSPFQTPFPSLLPTLGTPVLTPLLSPYTTPAPSPMPTAQLINCKGPASSFDAEGFGYLQVVCTVPPSVVMQGLTPVVPDDLISIYSYTNGTHAVMVTRSAAPIPVGQSLAGTANFSGRVCPATGECSSVLVGGISPCSCEDLELSSFSYTLSSVRQPTGFASTTFVLPTLPRFLPISASSDGSAGAPDSGAALPSSPSVPGAGTELLVPASLLPSQTASSTLNLVADWAGGYTGLQRVSLDDLADQTASIRLFAFSDRPVVFSSLRSDTTVYYSSGDVRRFGIYACQASPTTYSAGRDIYWSELNCPDILLGLRQADRIVFLISFELQDVLQQGLGQVTQQGRMRLLQAATNSDGPTYRKAHNLQSSAARQVHSTTLEILLTACQDGLRNGDEQGVDCGGSCGQCTPLPVPDTCFDRQLTLLPVAEEGVDCGGLCRPCSPCGSIRHGQTEWKVLVNCSLGVPEDTLEEDGSCVQCNQSRTCTDGEASPWDPESCEVQHPSSASIVPPLALTTCSCGTKRRLLMIARMHAIHVMCSRARTNKFCALLGL